MNLDSFWKRYALRIMAFAVAFLLVLLLNPHPTDLLGSLSLWAYAAPVVLTILFSILFYLKFKREKGQGEEPPPSGE